MEVYNAGVWTFFNENNLSDKIFLLTDLSVPFITAKKVLFEFRQVREEGKILFLEYN